MAGTKPYPGFTSHGLTGTGHPRRAEVTLGKWGLH